MDKLLSDYAKTEISNKVRDILRHITFQIGILSPTTRTQSLLNDYKILDQYSDE